MAWRGTWYLVRKCWRSFRGLFLFCSEPGFLRKTLCCKLTWELRRHLRRYNNEAKPAYVAVANLGVLSDPNSAFLCGQKWRFNTFVRPNSYSLKKKTWLTPPDCLLLSQGIPVHTGCARWGHSLCTDLTTRPPLQQGHRRSRILEEQSSCVCSRSGEPLKPGQDPRKAMDGHSWVFYLVHSEANAAVHESLSAMRQWPLHDMWLPSCIKQKEKKQGGRRDRVGFILSPDIVTFFPAKCKDMECFPVEPKS